MSKATELLKVMENANDTTIYTYKSLSSFSLYDILENVLFDVLGVSRDQRLAVIKRLREEVKGVKTDPKFTGLK